MKHRLSLTVFVLVGALMAMQPVDAFAKAKKRRVLPGGIVFPNLNEAASVNPATLKTQKGQAVQVLYSPPLEAGTTAHDYTLSFASVSKDFGLGAGYTGTYDTAATNQLTHGAFVGGGFSTGDFGFGVALKETDLSDTTSAQLDLGFNFGVGKSMKLSAVVRDVTTSSRTAAIGFGYEKAGVFNLELNVTTPTFDNLGTTNYVPSLIGGIYAGMFGAAWTTSYNIGTDTFTNKATGLISVGDNFDITISVDMASTRTFTFGLTIGF
ncbi:MAG: hypothetical protein H6617_09165 [Bdellovibrionaceae bacterium]|nr:hypothetical protein [Bdellovibrionales bacterium]MCB9254837.1 hypothetical protein [Pseudobdellovibrionaceae bacterium]